MFSSTLVFALVVGAGLSHATRYTPFASDAKRSWTEMLDGLEARDQSWIRDASPRSTVKFDIGCSGVGPGQSPNWTDIYDTVSTWFNGSNTGPKCHSNLAYTSNCSVNHTDACTYDGSYAVWNEHIMDCHAFVALEKAVKLHCADGGHPDCGCGVYKDNGHGRCLVSTYTYHISGPGTINSKGNPQEPIQVGVKVNHRRRDTWGPYYNDLSVCAHSGSGDVRKWCESSKTHVCH